MNRVICCIAFVLMVSCARAPQKALWECVEMDIDSTRTVNDSIARFAYNYYSRHGSERNRMMATYYLGQAEYDAGQIIPATLHFKQAYKPCKILRIARWRFRVHPAAPGCVQRPR